MLTHQAASHGVVAPLHIIAAAWCMRASKLSCEAGSRLNARKACLRGWSACPGGRQQLLPAQRSHPPGAWFMLTELQWLCTSAAARLASRPGMGGVCRTCASGDAGVRPGQDSWRGHQGS